MRFASGFRMAAVAALLMMTCPPATAAELPDSPTLLPPVVFGYVSVSDVAVLKERLADTSLGAMLEDSKFDGIRKQIQDALSEAGGKAEQELGVSLSDLKEIPSGNITFAVVQVGGPGEVGFLLMLDYGDNADTVDKLIQKAESGIDSRGGKRSTETIEGTEVVVYTIPKKGAVDDDSLDSLDEPSDTATESVAMFRKDDRLVIGNGVPALEAVLARWDGSRQDTFANDKTFQYIAEKTKSDDRAPVLVWFVNPLGSVQAFVSGSSQVPPQAQMAMAFLPALGVTKLKAVGGSLDLATTEFDSVGKVFLYVEQPATGVFGLFNFPAESLVPPAWVSSAATGYFGANWDVQTAWTSTRNLVDMFRGPGGFDQVISQVAENGPKINLKDDIFDQLTGQFHIVTYPLPETTVEATESMQQPTVVAMGVKDEQKMMDLLKKLAGTPGFTGESRQFQGVTVWDLPLKANGDATASVAVSKGNLLFSSETTRLEEVLRGGAGDPLTEDAGYQQVASHLPRAVSMMAFQDQRDQVKAVYEMLRSGKADEQLSDRDVEFDFSTLPPFDDVKEYLTPSGSYAVPDANGALFVSFSVKRN